MWRMHYTIIMNLPKLPKILETMHRMVDRPELYTEQEQYDYVRYITGLMQKTGKIKTECFGSDNLPKDGGYLLCPNHQGKYDAYSIVSAHEKPLSVVMDRERSYFVLVNEIIEVLRGQRMDIQNVRQALTVINKMADELKDGRRYIIFPEGGYSDEKKNTLWDFRPGCFKAATKSGVPIVPVVLVDSYKVYNSWQLTPVKTQVHFLNPIPFYEYADLNTTQISGMVKERIAGKLSELGYQP